MKEGIDVVVCEVGPRDGLQMLSAFFPTSEKLAWIRAEASAGVNNIEVASLVPPSLVPQFADATEVIQGALEIEGLTVVALVPNMKGAQRAIELGVHRLNYAMSASETHNLKNVRRQREESLDDFRRIASTIRELPAGNRPRLIGGLACSLGCSYEGPVAVDEVRQYAGKLAEAGADEVLIADTVGYGDPTRVRSLFTALRHDLGSVPICAHFHDTRGLGLANVVAALDCGVRRFDASLAGLGGCQFAPGATGNIVMDDLCFLLESMGLRTGVDLQRLLAVRDILARNLPPVTLLGSLARAGLPNGYSPARQGARAYT